MMGTIHRPKTTFGRLAMPVDGSCGPGGVKPYSSFWLLPLWSLSSTMCVVE